MKIVLLILCALFASLIGYQLLGVAGQGQALAQDTRASAHDNIELYINEPGPLSSYAAIIERPLFSPDRKPPDVKVSELNTSVDVSELEELTIFGIVKSGDEAYAIIGNMGGKKEGKQVTVGLAYKGWTVNEITSNSVKFTGDNVDYELSIIADESSAHATNTSSRRQRPSAAKQSQRSYDKGKKPAQEKIITSSGGLIYNRKKRRSPIKIPVDQAPRKPLDEAELEALHEEGGYSFDDEALDEEYDDYKE